MPDTRPQQDTTQPHLGVRRWGDACFHPVEEEVPEGYIVDGFLIPHHEVCEIIDLTQEPDRQCRLHTAHSDDPS